MVRCSIQLAYLFLYNLLQFCGHTWIFANMMARFLSFGEDALADTFYSVGVVVSLCQLMSVLELFHIADEIEKAGLLPRFIQVMERNFVLFVVIISQEEVQSKSIVCIQFFLWNTLDLLRYPHGLLALFSTPSFSMLWVRHTLWIPLYPLSVIAEVMHWAHMHSTIKPLEFGSTLRRSANENKGREEMLSARTTP
ncbi:very-long-chain (3R)-3-hydroxyacyl-CoA dehydratase 4 isoform X3 [Anguilla rostrata]|uniref:very-long-chain (3R)-3-hydroxyacyl-CoA dehydratase 4 isoform X3 n=1 Tax=Anguilla rostrata TaxID=7938 RepID=UPI0030CDBC46